MDVLIYPSKLNGEVLVPSSKSEAHRLIICAALSRGRCVISNVFMSQDIKATIGAVTALGAKVEIEGNTLSVNGIENIPEEATIDCCESGSTLRFLIPVAAALGVKTTFIGKGKLPERPITPYLTELTKNGVVFDYNNTMPFTVSGKLTSGVFEVRGDISSQFITGLLLALSRASGESEIILTSKLESKPYADMTVNCLERFGVRVIETVRGYKISGCEALKPCDCEVEGDYSQAAFFVVANVLGSSIKLSGLNEKSLQGDMKIVEICRKIVYNNKDKPKAFTADCSDIPDLVPILTVLACMCDGQTVLSNVQRLRIKESDRLQAISDCINTLGGDVRCFDDRLVINGVDGLHGGKISSYNDHRIAMAAAIATTVADGEVIIEDAQCVKKSYPHFFEDYKKLGGKLNGFSMES